MQGVTACPSEFVDLGASAPPLQEQERAAVEKMTSQELWGYLLHATSGPAAPKGGVKAEEGKQVVGTQVTAGQGPAAGAEDASAERKMASRRQARRVDVIDQVPPPDHLKELQLTLYPSLSASSQRGARRARLRHVTRGFGRGARGSDARLGRPMRAGGRKVAPDPRDDPTISPTRAARILNNRLSAARSKKRQREAQQLAKEVRLAKAWLPVCDAAGASRTSSPLSLVCRRELRWRT